MNICILYRYYLNMVFLMESLLDTLMQILIMLRHLVAEISRFKFEDYRVIRTGASDLKLYLGGVYTGPTSAANRGSTHLRRTRAELVPHSLRSWPALEPRLCPIAGRRKPQFNREVSEPRLCQEPQAAFPVWVPRFQATGPRYTSRNSCLHTFMPYSTWLIGNLPVFS